jgi:hypothetical protein
MLIIVKVRDEIATYSLYSYKLEHIVGLARKKKAFEGLSTIREPKEMQLIETTQEKTKFEKYRRSLIKSEINGLNARFPHTATCNCCQFRV